MLNMACMFCRGSGKLFNLYQNYGITSNTVRDDMVEFFGIEVENYLTHDDHVCNLCMNILDNIAKLKRFMWSIITNPTEYKYHLKMGKFLNHFATLNLDDEDFWSEPITPRRTPTPFKPAPHRSPTPDLLSVKYSLPYEDQLEDAIAKKEMNKVRSLSRGSNKSKSDVSTNEEVEIIFKKREKKKGHKWTRVKGSQRRTQSTSLASYARSRMSKFRRVNSDIARPYSSLSDASFLSYYEMGKYKYAKRPILEYDENGELLNRRTRSVCKLVEEEAREKFACNERNCRDVYFDVDDLTEHKVTAHNCLAQYVCDECNSDYTTKDHLKNHYKIHDLTPLFCFICGTPLENCEKLKIHVDQHLEYSVPCLYCDLSFLNKRLCEEHIRHVHRGRKHRRVYRKKLILERVNNYETRSESSLSGDSTTKEKTYEVKVMVLGKHRGVEMDSDIDESDSDEYFEGPHSEFGSNLSDFSKFDDPVDFSRDFKHHESAKDDDRSSPLVDNFSGRFSKLLIPLTPINISELKLELPVECVEEDSVT